jgi:hypothetical protein
VTAPTRHRPSPTSFPVPKTIPHTGAGGFSLLSAARLVAAAASSQTLKPQMRHRSRQANRIAALPRTGGGTGGGVPISPLAPLALIAGLAIVAGRLVKRPNQR